MSQRVISSLPDAPLTRDQIDGLEDSDGFAFASPPGFSPDDAPTNEMVVATESKAMRLLRQPGVGWVVDHEKEHGDREPEQGGIRLWMYYEQDQSWDTVDEIMEQFEGNDE